MSEYEAKSRSNRFSVRDPKAFASALAHLDIEVRTPDPAAPRLVELFSRGDHGTWPTSYYDEDLHDDVPVDIAAIVADHLAPGHVAVLVEVGAQKFCYLGGAAVAVNSTGEQAAVHLDEIYDHARHLGPHMNVIGAGS